jgi:hypothetical protein
MFSQPIRISAPPVPANNGTVSLVDTTYVLGKLGLRANGIHRIIISFPGLDQASAASGMIGYKSPNKGTNWYQDTFAPSGGPSALPLTVPAATDTSIPEYDIDVSTADEVKITFTAGAAAPTVWFPVITLEPKRVSGV